MTERIQEALERLRAENRDVARRVEPDRDWRPDYHQRAQERQRDDGGWSGASGGGGVWAGRASHRER